MRRIVALDGLRGVAVMAVLASHAFAWAHGGFLGVDVFFVLSGYLITTLLLAERKRTGRFDVLDFYRRRIARLAPAYLLMLVVAVPIMAGPLVGVARWSTPLAVAATATYLANWANVVDVDALGPITHTWSLSVEEQFYLLWPGIFVALSRSRRSLVRWLAAAITVVVVLRLAGWLLVPGVWLYFATVTHADGLLAGCLLAVLLAEGRSVPVADRWPTAAAAAGVVVLVVMAATLGVENGATYLGGLTLAAAATTAVVHHLVTRPGSRLGRLLELGPLAWVGRISYGLYLFHMPVFQLVQHGRLGFVPTTLLEFGGAFALAAGSWYLVERPVQGWARRRSGAVG